MHDYGPNLPDIHCPACSKLMFNALEMLQLYPPGHPILKELSGFARCKGCGADVRIQLWSTLAETKIVSVSSTKYDRPWSERQRDELKKLKHPSA